MIKKVARNLLGGSVYALWRHFRKTQQRRAFDELLLKISDAQKNITKDVVRETAAKRPLSERPVVVGLGHMAWEKFGLWPSFERLSDFSFIPLGPDDGVWNQDLKAKSGKAVLAKIDELDRVKKVELVFIYADAFFVDEAMLKELSRRGIWTVMMGLDDKHKFEKRREYGFVSGQSMLAPLVDCYWTTWKAGMQLFETCGAHPIYLAEGADPSFHQMLHLPKDIDVLFLGSCYGERKALVQYLCKMGIQVEAYGSGWPNGFVSFEQSIELINRSKVVLGLGGVGHLEGVQHLKGRDFEVPMCGAVYLTSYNPELADWYDIGREILCYSSYQNCVEILHFILGDEAEQKCIREAALKRSKSEHTWEHRIQTVLDSLRKASDPE